MGLFDKLLRQDTIEIENDQIDKTAVDNWARTGDQLYNEGESLLKARNREEALKKFSAAIDNYQQGLKISKKDPELWIKKARCLDESAQISKKNKQFENAINYYRGSLEAYENAIKFNGSGKETLTTMAAQMARIVCVMQINEIECIIEARAGSRKR
jgi:tetratricopeptide (TPR) repeat protein